MVRFITVLLLLICCQKTDDPYNTPSESFSFDFAPHRSWGEYSNAAQLHLQKNRVSHVVDQHHQEIDLVSPFHWPPSSGCSKVSKGVVFIHGLLGTPFSMRDSAGWLRDRCVRVSGLLLPGHGTRTGDLITVSRSEWLAAVKFGIAKMAEEVDEIFLFGYSLGGLLTTILADSHPKIRGIVVLSPAWAVRSGFLADQTTWARYLVDWVNTGKNDIAVRYRGLPTNAVAETSLLAKRARSLMAEGALTQNMLVIQSLSEETIDPQTNLELFLSYLARPNQRMIAYGPRPNGVDPSPQVDYRSFSYPKYQVVNFSHQTLMYAPSNPLFGIAGSYKECGQGSERVSDEAVSACLSSDKVWRGEYADIGEEFLPRQRLTFNPDFENMMIEIFQFISSPPSAFSGNSTPVAP